VRLHPFRPRLLDTLRGYDRARFAADAWAGITVGVVALPLAMAFAVASGLKPEQGLITAIVAGLLISALGGSNVQIGGPAGAFIVVVYGIVERYGLTNLLICTSLAGVLLFVLGWLRLGTLVRYLPLPIVIGFTNGIAVLIALAQVKELLGLPIAKLPADFFAQVQALGSHLPQTNLITLALSIVCIGGLWLWPRLFGDASRLPPAVLGWRGLGGVAKVPAPIVALVTVSLASWWLQLPVDTIGSRFGGIPLALPQLELPAFSWDSAKQLVAPTITLTLLGAVESLLCARIADKLADDIPRHDPNQELMAQGIANFVTPLVGGMPATGTIARTVTNVRAGGRTPVAGIVHALAVLAVVLIAAPLATHVPLAVLASIALLAAWNMGEWREFSRLRRFALSYRTILVGTFVLTIVFDLTVAVQIGLVLACVFFIWRMGALFRAAAVEQPALPAGVRLHALYGALFFGAVGRVEALADTLPDGTRALVLDAHRLVAIDSSGLDALRQLQRALARRGVTLVLADLNDEPASVVRRTGFDAELGSAGLAASVDEALARWRD
jgi:SulP family sulfate permease